MLAWTWYYDLNYVLFFSFLWNIFWNIISFYYWKKLWINVLNKWFLFLKAKYFIWPKLFIEKNWWKSIFLWKLTPWMKENISFIAGILNMSTSKFLFWDILWAIAWSFIFVWFWFIFSSSLSLAEAWVTRFWYFILIIILLFLIFYIIKIFIIKFWKKFYNLFYDLFQFLKVKFLAKKSIKIFVKNHPKIIFFLKNRIDKSNFSGLPFTILFLILIYFIFEYIWFTNTVLNNDLMTQIDIRLSKFFFYFRDIKLINLFLFISYFWTQAIVILISIILTFILFLKWKINEIIWLITSVWVTSLIVIISKNIIARSRPELRIYNESGYSFPSFHATISVVLYGFIIWLFFRKTIKWKTRINYIYIWIITSLLIWLSRLYLNVHYLSDVIWWYFLWLLWLTFWITIVWFLNYKYKKNNKIYFKKYHEYDKYLIYIFVLLWIMFSIFHINNYYFKIILTQITEVKFIKIDDIIGFFGENPGLKYTETITWRRTEPINFIFTLNNEDKLINLLNKSWWTEADKIWRRSMKKIWEALFDHIPYFNAPIIPLYWNKDIQNLWFQKLTNDENIKFRHHIRIWKTDYMINDKFIYIWCWIYDNWLKWWITHKVDPNIDKEREYIFNDFKNTWIINNYIKIQFEDSFEWKNFSWDKFFTDGKVYIINL